MSRSDVTALSSKAKLATPAGEVHPGLPPVLAELLSARGDEARDAAWARFIAVHTALLLHACHAVSRDRDAAMDGYAFVLDALREESCHRLRAYEPQPGTQFTTWLVVVARRLLLDHYRHRYGRARSEEATHREELLVRRRLEDMIAVELEPDMLTTSSLAPDASVMRHESAAALRSAVDELAPSDRLLLALRFEDERPVKAIAQILGLPSVFHVYRRLGIVLGSLRRTLVARGVDAPEP